MTDSALQARAVSPQRWSEGFSGPPNLCSSRTGWSRALVRRWSDTAATMEQPALDHHYIILHQGGPKRVTRHDGRRRVVAETRPGAISVVPAGTTFTWQTEGPIGFAHLYLHPDMVGHVMQHDFDRDPAAATLTDCVARHEPLLEALLNGMIAQIESPSVASRLMLDTMLQAFVVSLLGNSPILQGARPARHSLAPRRLRAVIDYIEAHLARHIGLHDLAAVAGSSPFHFSRAFRQATGLPPYRYLIHRRVERARALLREDRLAIDEVAAQCGFNSYRQFSAMFTQLRGVSPARYRRER